MVELVDTTDLKSVVCIDVRVQVPLGASFYARRSGWCETVEAGMFWGFATSSLRKVQSLPLAALIVLLPPAGGQ